MKFLIPEVFVAIDYDLHCECDSDDDKIVEVLREGCSAIFESRSDDGGILLHGIGIWYSVHHACALQKSLTNDAFGFTPKRTFGFRLDKFEDYEAGNRFMWDACAVLLLELAGDAVFLWDGELPLLLRKSGELTLREKDRFWKAELTRLAQTLAQPYVFRDMPIL